MAIVKATDQSFSAETSEGVVLADFWAFADLVNDRARS